MTELINMIYLDEAWEKFEGMPPQSAWQIMNSYYATLTAAPAAEDNSGSVTASAEGSDGPFDDPWGTPARSGSSQPGPSDLETPDKPRAQPRASPLEEEDDQEDDPEEDVDEYGDIV